MSTKNDTSSKKGDFTSKMAELEAIVAWFDSGEVNLDEAVAKFERGSVLAKELKSDISDIENKVKKIQAQA